MSRRLNLLNFVLKWTLRPVLNRVKSKNPAKLRPWLDKPMEWGFRPRRGTKMNAAIMSDLSVPVLQIENGDTSNGTLFYLHGGAFVFGSAQTHRRLVAHICKLCDLKGLSVNYRLAPEHPFPAGLDDAFAVYKELVANGTKNIVLAGDSAGGGLAFALLAKILAAELPKPICTVAFSPWVDLTLTGESMIINENVEYLLPPHQIRQARDYYAPKNYENPYVSPLFADFSGAFPVLIFVGSNEVLKDDAVRMAENLRKCDVDVTLKIYKKTPHVWVMAHGRLPEADRAIAETCDFIKQVLHS